MMLGRVAWFLALTCSSSLLYAVDNPAESVPKNSEPPHALTDVEFHELFEVASTTKLGTSDHVQVTVKDALQLAKREAELDLGKMNATELVNHEGYALAAYEVKTEDGYWLTLFRMSNKDASANSATESKGIVFLQHGLFESASHFLMDNATNSLPYILVDNGYDVWLGNVRGTSESLRHQTLDCDSAAFWQFSFHEMAVFDLPAMIDFVWHKTERKHKIHYVGHSMGGLMGLIKFSRDPGWASERIAQFIALAPASYLNHSQNAFQKLHKHPLLEKFVVKTMLKMKSIHPSDSRLFEFAVRACLKLMFLCKHILNSTSYNMQHLDKSRMEVYLRNTYDRTSMKTLVHFGQITTAQRPQEFDSREDKSKGDSPAAYDFRQLSVPIVLFTGLRDRAIVPEDVDLLKADVAHVLKAHYVFEVAKHKDFIGGLYAPKFVFNRVLNHIQNHSDGEGIDPSVSKLQMIKGDI